MTTYQCSNLSVEANQKLVEFEKQILQLTMQYFVEPLKSQDLPNNLLKLLVEKQENKTDVSAFEQAFLQEYSIRQLKDFILQLQPVLHKKIEKERKNEEVLSKEKLLQEAIDRVKTINANPAYIAWKKENAICEKYGFNKYQITFKVGEFDEIKYRNLPTQIIQITEKLDLQIRVSEDDLIWLNTEGREDFFTSEVKIAVHRLEADYYLQQYEKNKKDNWQAINASSHLRKCEDSLEAEIFLEKTGIKQSQNKKLCSAYFTTLGGVKRDLGKSNQAIQSGEQAHKLMPDDYRPCTLLGAVYIESRDFELGHEWYEKAKERGAPTKMIDSEIRSIIIKLKDPVKRTDMIERLIKLDAGQYQWLEKYKLKTKSKTIKK